MRNSYARNQDCAICGHVITAKRSGFKQKYCSNRCRDTHRRQLNFAFFDATRYPPQGKPRNATNPSTISKYYKAENRDRGSAVSWRRIVQIEVIEPHTWTPITSTDGVTSQQATLRRSALVGKVTP